VTRRDAQSTRQRLLDAGLELLDERGIDLGLRNIPVTDVAERAGHTTGAVYQIWKRQRDFHRDLALHAVREDDWSDRGVIEAAVGEANDRASDLQNAFGVGADAYLSHLVDSRSFRNLAHFWAVARSDPALAEAIKAGYDASHAEFRSLFGSLLERFELVPRPPFSIDDITVSFVAVAEGFALRHAIDPERVAGPPGRDGDGDPQGWTLMTWVLEAALARMTKPAGAN